MRLRPWPTCLFLLLPVVVHCSATAGGEAQDGQRSVASAHAPAARVARSQVTLAPPGRDAVNVQVELARSKSERERGLMFRKQLAPDAGMLFLFEQPQQLTFWMRNTYLPLDMIFITEDLEVLGVVENATPLTDDPRRVQGESRYVLEVNAGFSRRHGVQPGTSVRFVDVNVASQEPKP